MALNQMQTIQSLGKCLAFAYIKTELNLPGTELEGLVMGEPRRAVIVEQCVYAAKNELPRTEG